MPDKNVKLENWDHYGPEVESDVASFTILDPEKPTTGNSYCIGFKFLGGKFKDTRNWIYDHTNYWDLDRENKDVDYIPTPVSQEKLLIILDKMGISLAELLELYCSQL